MADKEKFRYKSISVFSGDQKVDVFITRPLDRSGLEAEWISIRNEVANIQSKVEDEFERWNHYLFYLVDDDVMNDINLKYKIEHDTISSRKILIAQSKYREDGFDAVVKKYIQYAFNPRYFEIVEEFDKSKDVLELLESR